jgi:hypothetical protein
MRLVRFALTFLLLFVIPKTGFPVIISLGGQPEILLQKGRVPPGTTWSKNLQLEDKHLKLLTSKDADVYEFWIQTEPTSVGAAWRPPASVGIQIGVFGTSTFFKDRNPQLLAAVADDPIEFEMFVRYSADKVHWSTWQLLGAAESCVEGNSGGCGRRIPFKGAMKSFAGTIGIPNLTLKPYNERLEKWKPCASEIDYWRWLEKNDPGYIEKEIPLIGYLQFRLEGQIDVRDLSLTSIKPVVSSAVSGISCSYNGGTNPSDTSGVWNFVGKEKK